MGNSDAARMVLHQRWFINGLSVSVFANILNYIAICYIYVLIRSLTISHLAVDDWGRGVWLRVIKIRMLPWHGNTIHGTTLWGVPWQTISRMPFTTSNWTLHQLHRQVVLRHQVRGLLEVLVRRLRTRSEPFWQRGWMQTGMWKSKRTSSVLP